MEGKAIPYLKNWLRENRDQSRRVEDGKALDELVNHEGWGVLQELAEVMVHRDQKQLAAKANETALSADPQKRIDFARRLGLSEGLTVFRDIAASGIESAKTAASELREQTETAAAEGTNS